MDLAITFLLVLWAIGYGVNVFVQDRTVEVITGVAALAFGILTLVNLA